MSVQYRMLISLAGVLAAATAGPAIAQAQASSGAPAARATTTGDVSRDAFLANANAEFDRIDTNKDGKLSKDEVAQNSRAMWLARAKASNLAIFKQLDKNHDGTLSPEEFSQLVGQPPAFTGQEVMTRLDTNHDNEISRDEFRAAGIADFNRLDADKNGVLSPSEIAAARVRKPSSGGQ